MRKLLIFILFILSTEGFGQTLPLINVGKVPNDGTGDPIRTAFIKTNSAISLINTRLPYWNAAYTERLRWSGTATGLTAATGRTSLGGTTVGQNLFTLPNPGAIRTILINADNSVTATSITGTGDFVRATSPTLVTPLLGTPTSGVMTNVTGTAAGLTAGSVTGFTPAGGTLTLAGADAVTLTTTGVTDVTLPTTGTLITSATIAPQIHDSIHIHIPTNISSTEIGYLNGVTGTTGTGNLVLSAAPTITGHPTVEGVTSTGATGTGNLVYSASPTLSGTLAMGAGNITMTGSLGATGVGKLTKIWSVDGEFTNLPTINGGTLKAGLGVTTVGNSYMTLVNPSAITFPRMNADNTVTAQTAANYRTDLGATTVGANLFTLANPSAITFPRFNADNTVTALSAANFKTALSLTSTDVGLNNLTNKLQVELEDSVNYANGYMSRYDGVTGLALKLNLADSVNYTNGYTSKYDSRFLDATSSIQTQLDSKTDTTELNEIVYIEDATISGGVVKITIGWDGAAGCDFVWTGAAGHAAQNLDIGSIIPAKADVIKVDVVNTEALVGCTDMNIGVGNASGGAQYVAAASLDELNEVITSTAVLTDAVLMNWAAASNVWISGDPSDNNWSDMTAGKWTVYVTYVYYGNL